MKILDKYLFKSFIQPFLYCLILFLFLYVIIDLFEHIDDFTKQHIDFATLLMYYAAFLPTIFVQTTPVAVLVATVYSLGNFNKNNEITAMRASGISFFKIISPLLVAGFIISLMVFAVNEILVPKATIVNSRIKEEKIETGKKSKPKIIENLALYGSKNRLIFIRSFNAEANKLEEIIIQENDDSANLSGKIIAKDAEWQNGSWLMHNCIITKLTPSGEIIGEPQFFTEKIIDLDETPNDLVKIERRAEFMNYGELRNYIGKFSKGSFKTLRKLNVDLEHKIAFPFTSFVVIFAASPFALFTRRGGALIGIGLSLLMGLAYYAVMSIALALGKSGILIPVVSAWFANISFGLLGIYHLKKIS